MWRWSWSQETDLLCTVCKNSQMQKNVSMWIILRSRILETGKRKKILIRSGIPFTPWKKARERRRKRKCWQQAPLCYPHLVNSSKRNNTHHPLTNRLQTTDWVRIQARVKKQPRSLGKGAISPPDTSGRIKSDNWILIASGTGATLSVRDLVRHSFHKGKSIRCCFEKIKTQTIPTFFVCLFHTEFITDVFPAFAFFASFRVSAS